MKQQTKSKVTTCLKKIKQNKQTKTTKQDKTRQDKTRQDKTKTTIKAEQTNILCITLNKYW